MTNEMKRVISDVATRFHLSSEQIETALQYLKAGECVPFIVRYRALETKGVKTTPLRLLSRQLVKEARQAEKVIKASEKRPEPKNPVDALMRQIKSDESILSHFRSKMWEEGLFFSRLHKQYLKQKKKPKKQQPKWDTYLHEGVSIQRIPKHHLPFLFRGRSMQALSLNFAFEDADYGKKYLTTHFTDVPEAVLETCWKKHCMPQLEAELFAKLRTRLDDHLIGQVEKQVQSILLTPNARLSKPGCILGMYAEGATQIGVATIDTTGAVREALTLYPFDQAFRWHDAIATLAKHLAHDTIDTIALGNGPYFMQMKRLLAGVAAQYPDMPFTCVPVDEAGMIKNISADKGAISVARRLQNPLYEMLKTPVDQMYFGELQALINPKRLVHALNDVIEDVVSRVGVDVNTAPAAVLQHAPGLNASLAKALVAHREAVGGFKTREALNAVPGLDETAFQQAAGFLCVSDAEGHALDVTRLHPMDYERIKDLTKLDAQTREYLEKLKRPWRDVRSVFQQPKPYQAVIPFHEFKKNEVREGVVVRLASFGAFIDVGTDVLGLLHHKVFPQRFMQTPYEIFRIGDVLSVRVLDVDTKKHQLGLASVSKPVSQNLLEMSKKKRKNKTVSKQKAPQKAPLNTAMADAFAKLKRGAS